MVAKHALRLHSPPLANMPCSIAKDGFQGMAAEIDGSEKCVPSVFQESPFDNPDMVLFLSRH